MGDMTVASAVSGSTRASQTSVANESNTKKASLYEVTSDASQSLTGTSESVQNQLGATPNSKVLGNADELLGELNSQLGQAKSYLKFEKDEDAGRTVFYIKNAETDEVLRQVPAEEMLQISKNISEYLETVNQRDEAVSMPIGMITNEVV